MVKQLDPVTSGISYDYIRGLIEGEGCFTFSSTPTFIRKDDGSFERIKYPAFILAMHERDRELLEMMRGKLKVSKSINWLKPSTSDGYQRGATVRLIIRDLGTLKNIIIPLVYNRLYGYKKSQFNSWLERIGDDPAVHESFKILYRLHKTGYFTRELSPTGLFRKFVD